MSDFNRSKTVRAKGFDAPGRLCTIHYLVYSTVPGVQYSAWCTVHYLVYSTLPGVQYSTGVQYSPVARGQYLGSEVKVYLPAVSISMVAPRSQETVRFSIPDTCRCTLCRVTGCTPYSSQELTKKTHKLTWYAEPWHNVLSFNMLGFFCTVN